MKKRILNVYKSRHIAQSEFKVACRDLHAEDVANHANLSINGGGITTVFGYYSDYSSFCHKYLHGMEWYLIKDFANIPYDLYLMAQSRIRE